MGKLDWTKPLQTRDGRKAQFMGSIDRTRNIECMRVEIERRERPGYTLLMFYRESGRRYEHGISELDLVNSDPEASFGPVDMFHSIISELRVAELTIKAELQEQVNKNNQLVAEMTRISSHNAFLTKELAKAQAVLVEVKERQTA